ncbi:hypothetical protein [Pseudonocardia kunmingensis]|uniref:Uncharacterized protein n=1 Tax=Pseudonocardia kunmingensis TaxID=630975 RepID=A0A543DPG1_9PSEU|nr:hypothetical protein [Pseudonocardia kunmingensis]TQM11199.1 hypothetical protein FB558_3753 [Pseudonocardia kunmingensis]
MKPRVGQSLASTVDSTTVIVIRWPDEDLAVTCGGIEMVLKGAAGEPKRTPDPSQMDGTQLGKRYADDVIGIELLCTKAGQGTLAVGGVALPLKDARALPASD